MVPNNFLIDIPTCHSLSSFQFLSFLPITLQYLSFLSCQSQIDNVFFPKQRVLPLFSLFSCPHLNPKVPVLKPCGFFPLPSYLLAMRCLSSSCNINVSKDHRFIPLLQNPYLVSIQLLFIGKCLTLIASCQVAVPPCFLPSKLKTQLWTSTRIILFTFCFIIAISP